MKKYFCLACALLLLLVSCDGTQEKTKEQSANDSAAASTPCKETAISKETAILIAKGDAVEEYTLSVYDIIADEKPEAWRIVFKLKEAGVYGGGPDYLIDKKTGKILNATYYK